MNARRVPLADRADGRRQALQPLAARRERELLLPLKGPGHLIPPSGPGSSPALANAEFPAHFSFKRRRDAVVLVYDRIGDHLVGNNVCIPGNLDWSY